MREQRTRLETATHSIEPETSTLILLLFIYLFFAVYDSNISLIKLARDFSWGAFLYSLIFLTHLIYLF